MPCSNGNTISQSSMSKAQRADGESAGGNAISLAQVLTGAPILLDTLNLCDALSLRVCSLATRSAFDAWSSRLRLKHAAGVVEPAGSIRALVARGCRPLAIDVNLGGMLDMTTV